MIVISRIFFTGAQFPWWASQPSRTKSNATSCLALKSWSSHHAHEKFGPKTWALQWDSIHNKGPSAKGDSCWNFNWALQRYIDKTKATFIFNLIWLSRKVFVLFSGETIVIPRVKFAPTDHTLPIEMIRTQFPVKLAFSITSNKSQGQTLKHVGIYLEQDFFSHGQVRNFLLLHMVPSNCSPRQNCSYCWYLPFRFLAQGSWFHKWQKALDFLLVLHVHLFCFSYMLPYPEFRGHKT